jgi:RNA polymerase sigma factor (sigma-70 family)
MQNRNDSILLTRYAKLNDERAFAEILERYYPLVYRAAYAKTKNEEFANDVAAAVFLLLANRAKSIGPKVVVAGWLFKASRLTACNALRAEQARRNREIEAVKMAEAALQSEIAQSELEKLDMIDDGLMKLSEQDRNAVLLRYSEGLSINETAEALNVKPEAAKKRASRGIERLRKYCATHGSALSIAVIGAVLGEKSAHAAPESLNIVNLQSFHATSGSNIHIICQGAVKQMFLAKLKIAAAVLGSTAIIGTGSVAVIHAADIANQTPNSQSSIPPDEKESVQIGETIMRGDPAAQKAALKRIEDKAFVIRKELEPWARNHAGELNAMLNAKPNSIKELKAVMEVAPQLSYPYSQPKELQAIQDSLSLNSKSPNFAWEPLSVHHMRVSPGKEIILSNFKRHRDGVLFGSAVPGPEQIDIWVSGRITRTEFYSVRHGRRRVITLNRREVEQIALPYDFLKQ